MTRKALPTSRRAAIWQAHDRRCIYCTEPVEFSELHIDHIIPLNLKDKPVRLECILKEYGLDSDFDLDCMLNLVPSHGHCNSLKSDQVMRKSRALHYLNIAEERYDKAMKLEKSSLDRIRKNSITIKLQIALDEGLISRGDVERLLVKHSMRLGGFEILSEIPFADSSIHGVITMKKIDELYDRPILPRPNGLRKLTMLSMAGAGRIEVHSCREWVDAIKMGYFASSTYDIKEETHFRRVYALVSALSQASDPDESYISESDISISNYELLPISILPAIGPEGAEAIAKYESEGLGFSDLVSQGIVKIVSSSPLSLKLHHNAMGKFINEILRADMNNDGIEDMLIGSYEWCLEGSHGAGGAAVLTRYGNNSPFTFAKDVSIGID